MTIKQSVCLSVCLSVDKFLNDLSKKSVDAEGRLNEHAFRNRWRRHFSILLQKCNSSVILKKGYMVIMWEGSR